MITLTAKIVLEDGTEIAVDKRNILSLETSIIDRSDISLPSWGIISNRGSLTFADYDETVRGYADDLRLSDNAKVVVYLTNTITQSVKEIKNFLPSDWDYDSNSRTVSVSLKDDLEEWQNIQIDGFDYDVRNPKKVLQNQSMEDLYKWLYDRTPTKYNMKQCDALDNITKEILKTTIIQYPLLKSDKLWAQWNKLCCTCGLYIYKSTQGETTCAYNYGA